MNKQYAPKSKEKSDELMAQIDSTLLEHGTMSTDDRLALLREKGATIDAHISGVVDEQLGRQARNDHQVPGLSAKLAKDLSEQLAEKLVVVQGVDEVFADSTAQADSPFGPDVPVFADEPIPPQKHFPPER